MGYQLDDSKGLYILMKISAKRAVKPTSLTMLDP